MKAVFDYLITQLNANELNLVYKGNYIFEFLTDKMTVYEPVTGTLVSDEIEFSPVSLISKTPVTFVENNKRVDWLVEIGIAVRIIGKEYDATVDLDYANITSVINAMQNLALTSGGKRYSIKTDAEPTYQGYQMLGNSKYAILSVTMNVTELVSGYFGQDWTVKINGSEVDFVMANVMPSKRFVTTDDKGSLKNDYQRATGRAMSFEITLNYKDESTLLTEVMGSAGLGDTYTLLFEFGTSKWSYTVTCESAPMSLVKGAVMQITLRFLQANDVVTVT